MLHISYLVSAFFLISGWCHRYRVFTADVHGGFSHIPQENSFQPKTPHSGFPMPNDDMPHQTFISTIGKTSAMCLLTVTEPQLRHIYAPSSLYSKWNSAGLSHRLSTTVSRQSQSRTRHVITRPFCCFHFDTAMPLQTLFNVYPITREHCSILKFIQTIITQSVVDVLDSHQ